jgi:hypothetical protein
MKKLNFQDLEALNAAVSRISHIRIVLSHVETPQIIWRGPDGFFTDLQAILVFYEKYLKDERAFEDAVSRTREALEAISKEDSEKHFLSIPQYRDTFYLLVNAVEDFKQQILQHYSVNTLFQFSNITFNSDLLFSRIDSMFEKGSWDFIPTTAKADISEGGRALLFNLPTSASFMFLRALEDCMRQLCIAITKESKQRMFAEAISVIKDNADKFDLDAKEIDRQIQFLSYIKDEFRNPSAHPEKTFSQREAEQLFQIVNVAIDKLSKMHGRIK